MADTEASKGSWVVVHESDLMDLVVRAWEGEDPSLLMLEFYANCEMEQVDGPE